MSLPMSLPTTRPRTYVYGHPLMPEDINEIFDAIIDSKHPSRDLPVGAAAFQAVPGGGAVFADGEWTWTGFGTIHARLDVVAGTRITAIKFGYDRGGVSGMNFRLKRRNIVTGAALAIVASTNDAASAAGWRTITLAPNYVVEADHVISLYVDGAATGHKFGGAIVTMDRL